MDSHGATGGQAAEEQPVWVRRPGPLGLVDWAFRSRQDGTIVVAQRPNAVLAIFGVATVVRWTLRPDGDAGAVVDVIGTAAAVWWSGDELLRGVNPWRRLLGAVVLAATIRRLVIG